MILYLMSLQNTCQDICSYFKIYRICYDIFRGIIICLRIYKTALLKTFFSENYVVSFSDSFEFFCVIQCQLCHLLQKMIFFLLRHLLLELRHLLLGCDTYWQLCDVYLSIVTFIVDYVIYCRNSSHSYFQARNILRKFLKICVSDIIWTKNEVMKISTLTVQVSKKDFNLKGFLFWKKKPIYFRTFNNQLHSTSMKFC